MSETFLILALISIAWGIVSMIAITSFLQKRGRKNIVRIADKFDYLDDTD